MQQMGTRESTEAGDTESWKGLGPPDDGNQATVTQCPGIEARKDQGSEFQGDSNLKPSLREMEQVEQAGEAELYPE